MVTDYIAMNQSVSVILNTRSQPTGPGGTKVTRGAILSKAAKNPQVRGKSEHEKLRIQSVPRIADSFIFFFIDKDLSSYHILI